MARPIGVPNRRTARQAELFGPHVADAIKVIREIAGLDKHQWGDGSEVVNAIRDADRLAAAKIIIEYGLGKPVQITEVTGEDGDPIAVTLKVVKDGVNGAPPETNE